MPPTAGDVKTYEWTYDYDDIVLWHLHLSFLHHAIPSVEWFLSATSHMKGNRHAFREFALQYGIDVNVNALSGDGAWASQRFMRKRVAFFTSALRSVTRSGSGFGPPTPPPPGDMAGYCAAPLSY